MEGSHLLLSLGLIAPIPTLHLWASLWSTEVRLQGDRRKGFLLHQGSLSGGDAEGKEEEETTRSRLKGGGEERELTSPQLEESVSTLTSICEIHPLWMLGHCWLGAELYG